MANLYPDRSPDDWGKGNDVTDQQQTEVDWAGDDVQ